MHNMETRNLEAGVSDVTGRYGDHESQVDEIPIQTSDQDGRCSMTTKPWR
jgi:hypothetical protein